MISLLSAFLFRDIAIERTYRFNMLVRAFDVLFQLALFYFIAKLVGAQSYFPFVLAGLMFSRFFQFWMNVFTQNIRQEQYWGTAEALFLSPRSPFSVLFLSAGGKFLVLLLELLVYLMLGKYLFGVSFSGRAWLVLPVLCVNSLAFAGLGLISGSFILYFKRGDPANWFVSNSFDLLSGVYFPLSVLPSGLLVVSTVLPTTSALGIWRGILLNGSFPSLSSLVVQSGWAAVLFLAGFFGFRWSLLLTKKKGALGNY